MFHVERLEKFLKTVFSFDMNMFHVEHEYLSFDFKSIYMFHMEQEDCLED
jgi:hypothetical protein